MSRSEIDEIFATSARPPKKKTKTIPLAKSQHPETVLDPSEKQPAQKRRREKKNANVDDDRFKNSRGSAPRRKTVEGYNIYTEDELAISTTGGDTPLCPFDCQCCF